MIKVVVDELLLQLCLLLHVDIHIHVSQVRVKYP